MVYREAKRVKLIIVDDEITALNNFLSKIVDNTEAEYTMFNKDPLSAVEYVKKHNVDAAFLDVQMDAVNGVDLAELLLEAKPNIKIVFISGYEQDETSIREKLGDSLIGFCYKPYSEERLLQYINLLNRLTGENHVFIRTFGGFDILIDGMPVRFVSNKSKELLALLVDKKGGSLTLGEAVAFLWPDKNTEKSKVLYRDAVWKLRHVLSQYHLAEMVTFSRGQSVINTTFARCDYWDYLDGKDRTGYSGSYMPSYDWSIDTQSMLDTI